MERRDTTHTTEKLQTDIPKMLGEFMKRKSFIMLQAWADHLDSLREGGKVVPLFKAVGEE